MYIHKTSINEKKSVTTAKNKTQTIQCTVHTYSKTTTFVYRGKVQRDKKINYVNMYMR